VILVSRVSRCCCSRRLTPHRDDRFYTVN